MRPEQDDPAEVEGVMERLIASLSTRSLGVAIAVPVLLALAVNGILFALRLDSGGRGDAPLGGVIPGWMVGLIWTILFGAMGSAWWKIIQRLDDEAVPLNHGLSAATALLFLFLLCLFYPLYTLGFTSARLALLGNLVAMVAAFIVIWPVRRVSREAARVPALVFA